MDKRKTKLGKFGNFGKTSFQKTLRQNRIDKLISKDNLTKRESKLLSGKTALSSVASRGGKIGKFSNKTDSINALIQSSAVSPSSFNEALNMNTSLSISQFIDNPISKTGILSQKDVTKGVGSFMSKLRESAGITKLNVNKSGNVDVFGDYRKTSLVFNPKTLSFKTKGWDLDIPDNFIKVSDTKYVAPQQTFEDTRDYRRSSSGKKTDKITSGKYNPVTIFLSDDKNKLKSIIKKGTFTKDYSYEKNTSGSSRKTKDNDVYVQEQQDFFDSGMLKSINKFNDITTYDYDRNRKKSSGKDEDLNYKKTIYKTGEELFTDKGLRQSTKNWDDYESSFETKKSSDYDREITKKKVFLKKQIDYDIYGQKLRQQQWDDYTKNKETKGGDYLKKNVYDDTYLRYDTYYTGGKKHTEAHYDDFLTGYDSGRNSEEYDYQTGLDSVTYYDPITGKMINKEDYN